ncbi:MAG: hypothetical protein R3B06_30725 [Kofleriaceae bacterium]
MKKFGFAAVLATFVATLTIVGLTGSSEAAAPCKHPKMETKLVADACKAGGQKAAKDAMKKWMKEAKKKDSSLTCTSCHTKAAGDYPNKPDAVEKFKKLGGK